MAKITITIDTDENTLSGTIQGKEIQGDIQSVNVCRMDYSEYDRKREPELHWNIQVANETEGDDIKSYTNWCAASRQLGVDTEKGKADIGRFFDQKKGRGK